MSKDNLFGLIFIFYNLKSFFIPENIIPNIVEFHNLYYHHKQKKIRSLPEDSRCGRAGNPVELVPLALGHEEVLVVAVVTEAVDQPQKLNLQGHLKVTAP